MSDAEAYIAAITDPGRRAEAERLDAIFRDVTGWRPRLWQGRIVGYGSYDYAYPSGRSGTSLATGFGTGSKQIALHIMPGYQDFGPILSRLGKHRTGAACIYITRLENADEAALRDLIRTGLDRLATLWPVQPT